MDSRPTEHPRGVVTLASRIRRRRKRAPMVATMPARHGWTWKRRSLATLAQRCYRMTYPRSKMSRRSRRVSVRAALDGPITAEDERD